MSAMGKGCVYCAHCSLNVQVFYLRFSRLACFLVEDTKLAPTTRDLPPRILDICLVNTNTKSAAYPAPHVDLPYLVPVSV